MQGSIIRYDFRSGRGAITGDDGNRYSFSNDEWREDYPPAQDMRVDFDDPIDHDGQGRQATEIYAVAESHTTAIENPRENRERWESLTPKQQKEEWTTYWNSTQENAKRGYQASNGMKWWHWTLIGVGALFALIVLVAVVGRGSDSSGEQTASVSQSESKFIGPSEPDAPAERATARPGAQATDEEVWEYILKLAPILAFDDQLSEDEKDFLIKSYRIRSARPWDTATDEEIWEYILELHPLKMVLRAPDQDEVASLIESYRAHGAPREATDGRPGEDATAEEIWDYFLDLDPSLVLLVTDNSTARSEDMSQQIIAYHIQKYQEQHHWASYILLGPAQDNAILRPVATAQAVNTAVAAMNRPTGPITTPADLVARVEDGVVRVAGGSGFIFDVIEETAFVATNHHVIDGMRNVEVVVKNYETYDALTLGWDVERDVAVLSICCSHDFFALPWEVAAEPEIGDSVVAIGYPQGGGQGVTATVGEISESDVQSLTYGLIPHTAPLNPGNSGGPLFSMPSGKVLGINTARGTESLGFYAVPFQAIEEQVAQWRSQLVVPR